MAYPQVLCNCGAFDCVLCNWADFSENYEGFGDSFTWVEQPDEWMEFETPDSYGSQPRFSPQNPVRNSPPSVSRTAHSSNMQPVESPIRRQRSPPVTNTSPNHLSSQPRYSPECPYEPEFHHPSRTPVSHQRTSIDLHRAVPRSTLGTYRSFSSRPSTLHPRTSPTDFLDNAQYGSPSSFASENVNMFRPSPSDEFMDDGDRREMDTSRMSAGCDDSELANNYLSDGMKEIESVMAEILGNQFYQHVLSRALTVFKQSYDFQAQQKAGNTAFKSSRRGATTTTMSEDWKRRRFSRRKAFVISSIVVSFKEFGVSLPGHPSDRGTIEVLNKLVHGDLQITIQSVKKCCRDLGVDVRFRS